MPYFNNQGKMVFWITSKTTLHWDPQCNLCAGEDFLVSVEAPNGVRYLMVVLEDVRQEIPVDVLSLTSFEKWVGPTILVGLHYQLEHHYRAINGKLEVMLEITRDPLGDPQQVFLCTVKFGSVREPVELQLYQSFNIPEGDPRRFLIPGLS